VWMLRGKRNRWGPGLTDKAVNDLRLRPGEDGLSVYRVSDEADARSIATVHVVVHTEESSHDWILLPSSCVDAHNPEPGPDANLPEPLRSRHHLLKNLDPSATLQLARSVCETPDLRSFRQNRGDIRQLAPELIRRFDLKITDYWAAKLNSEK
jgi:hypothetical protein